MRISALRLRTMRTDLPLNLEPSAWEAMAREAAAMSDHLILDLRAERSKNAMLEQRVQELTTENDGLRAANVALNDAAWDAA